jgi:IclR family acetate operon transcriptional repressor
MTEPTEESPNRTSHNQSVMRAVALIRCFVDSSDGVTLSELARRTSTHVSTAHRILQTLVAGGILRRDRGTELYLPGPVLLALAGATFSSAGLGPVADVLDTVSQQTGESASIGIRDGNCVVVLLSAESPQQLRFGHVAGARLPIHSSAMGRALLAFGGEPIDRVVHDLGVLEPLTSRTPTAPAELERALLEIAVHRFAVVDEEQHVGVKSLGVPVARRGSPAQAALSVQGPATRLTPDRYPEIVAVLERAADLVVTLPSLDRLALPPT